jgi:hypothetical protein
MNPLSGGQLLPPVCALPRESRLCQRQQLVWRISRQRSLLSWLTRAPALALNHKSPLGSPLRSRRALRRGSWQLATNLVRRQAGQRGFSFFLRTVPDSNARAIQQVRTTNNIRRVPSSNSAHGESGEKKGLRKPRPAGELLARERGRE